MISGTIKSAKKQNTQDLKKQIYNEVKKDV
jgi:hypothetical protein